MYVKAFELNCHAFNFDQLSHKIVKPGPQHWSQIIKKGSSNLLEKGWNEAPSFDVTNGRLKLIHPFLSGKHGHDSLGSNLDDGQLRSKRHILKRFQQFIFCEGAIILSPDDFQKGADDKDFRQHHVTI